MRKILFLFVLWHVSGTLNAQNSTDSLKTQSLKTNADDPSQFFTRVELFNELQHHNRNGADFYLNQTILRTIVKVGKRFTTRIDLPLVNNTLKTPTKQQSLGLGDITFRLLGYKFLESPKSAFTASIEVSLNTAQSRLLGLGKNVLVPVVSYTLIMPKKKMLASIILQQANSVGGDENRETISFTKIQAILLKYLSKRSWALLAPEWYIDYRHGGVSMNLRSRFTYAPTGRINLWVTPSAGIFGNFAGRYQWSLDIGGRCFLLRSMNLNQKK